MTLLLRKMLFTTLTPADRQGVREVSPTLLLGEPSEYDRDGATWLAYTDSRWTPMHVAMIASMAVNLDALAGYDSPYVDNESGEITDREAYHEEMKALLQDPEQAPVPMTLPEDVEPSDPEADRPSLEDVRAAQEPQEGALNSAMRLTQSLDAYSRVEPQPA